MYVCICRGITDHQIRQEVSQGADTMRELSQRLGVGTQCGKCSRHARAVIREAKGDCSEGAAFGIWQPAA